MTQPVPPTGDLDDADERTVRQLAARLGLEPIDDIRRLTMGQSGTLVVRGSHGGRSVVLKITRDGRRLQRARSELRLIAERPGRLDRILPRYVAGHQNESVVCLAIQEHRPLPHPGQLTHDDWTTIATSIGHVHQVPTPTWWPTTRNAAPTPMQLSRAADSWTHLGYQDAARRAARILSDTATIRMDPSPTFTHGDCHTENAVRDDHGMIRWIDWQDARPGDGLGDIVFLWQRAEFAGARPPREAMLMAYCTARDIAAGPALRTLLDVAELRILFISWPPFLPNGSASAQQMMKTRLHDLVDILS